jgi:hypothetical protein
MFTRRSNQVARGPRSKTQVLAYQYYLQVLASQVLDVRHCSSSSCIPSAGAQPVTIIKSKQTMHEEAKNKLTVETNYQAKREIINSGLLLTHTYYLVK